MQRSYTHFIAFLIIISLVVPALKSNAQEQATQSTDLVFTLVFPERINGLTQSHKDKLENKVLRILTKNGIGSLGEFSPFIIVPSIEIYETSVAEGMRNIYITDAEFTLQIGQKSGEFFASYDKRIRGSGNNEKLAINNIITKIPTNSPDLGQFFQDAATEIKAYYEANCDKIISEAITLQHQEKFDEAILRLNTIPSYAESCYSKASAMIKDSYINSINEDCQKLLNIAQNAVALRHYEAAAYALAQIDPDATCYPESEAIKNEIKAVTQDFYDKIWEYADNRLDSYTEILKAKYAAMATVATGKYLNESENGGNDSGNSNQQTVVIANSGSNSVPYVRVISPLSRSGSSEAIVHDSQVSVYGIIDNVSLAEKLFVDGLETSWQPDGVFNRTIPLKSVRNKVEIKVEDKNGQKYSKTLEIVKQADENRPTFTSPDNSSSDDLKKIALVIGNNEYERSPLRNAVNDAESMSATLKGLGFKVNKVLNADYTTMKAKIHEFVNEAEGYNIAMFYYSGHGLEMEGANYLIPVDAKIETEQDIITQTIEADKITKPLELVNEGNLNIIILDACRSYPSGLAKSRSGNDGGLARMIPPSGMLIAFATAPGSTASDGSGSNGLYTGELVKQLQMPQRLEDIFMNTRNEVERKSNGRQRPWEEARLKGVYYLK